MHVLELKAQRPCTEDQLSAALNTLVTACETFIHGAGCCVEIDLDYCAALAQVEAAAQQGKKVLNDRKDKSFNVNY